MTNEHYTAVRVRREQDIYNINRQIAYEHVRRLAGRPKYDSDWEPRALAAIERYKREIAICEQLIKEESCAR